MILIGIDIGVTGAIAAIHPDDNVDVHDLPMRADGDGEKRIDAQRLLDVLQAIRGDERKVVAVFEDIKVRAFDNRPMSHSREASLSVSRGIVQACLDIADIKTRTCQPSDWKRFYGLIGAEKDDARLMAIRLYNHMQPLFARKKDHNRAEALLIARYGQRRLVEVETS